MQQYNSEPDNNTTHNNTTLLRALSPLTIDLSACFLYERPHAPIPFPSSPRATNNDDSAPGTPSRKRCRTMDEEETYQHLSNNLKSGCLRVPRFTKRHCIFPDNENSTHLKTPKIKKVKHFTPYEDIKKRIRHVAQLDMACQSLFDEMKATC